MPNLMVVLASTREQRAGTAIAEWFVPRARAHGKFDVQLVDLKEVDLPLFDEPVHPIKREYKHEHTRAWSRRVAGADAFVFVVPEYNFAMPPALLNAFDYVYHEWNYKPAGFVSYGGISGGLRSVQMARLVCTTLKMMPIPEGVALPYFAKQLGEGGIFEPGDASQQAATTMLDELHRWTAALESLRG